MGALSRFALRNPIVIWLTLLLIAGGGVYSTVSLHQSALPDVTVPIITVTTSYPGASADAVLDAVTKPMETALSSVTGVQSLDSVSAQGLSRVLLQFDVGTDTRALEREVADAASGVSLPSSAGRPHVDVSAFDTRPIVTFSLSGADTQRLTDIARNLVMPAFHDIAGVAAVALLGGAARDIVVDADPAKLSRYGVGILALDNAIKAGTASQPVGVSTAGGVGVPITAGNVPASAADISRLPIVGVLPASGIALGSASQAGATAGTLPVTATSSISQSIEQAIGYLNATRNELLVLSGPPPANAAIPIGSGWTQGAQASVFDALNIAAQQPAEALTDVRDAQNWLLKRTLKHEPGYAQNVHFSNALSWLQLAGTALAIGGAGASTLTIGDVATVTMGTPGIATIVHSNGRAGVLLQVARTDTADTSRVAAAVRAAAARLQLPAGVTLRKVDDVSDSIVSSIAGAVHEGLLGALLAVIIIGLFLRNWRATVIAAMNIPVSFLLTMTWLNAIGLTLNVITLAAVAVATGRVVDDSIVVIENLYRRIARGEAVNRGTILAGVEDVGAAIASSTATTICVFLPLAFVAGIVSTFFAPFAWTVTVHLIASYLAAMTVVPLLALILFGRGYTPREHDDNAVTRGYRSALAWSLAHRPAVLGAAALTVVIAVVVLLRLPTDLFPQTGPAAATVSVTTPSGSTVETTEAAATKLERVIARDGDVASSYTTIGNLDQEGLSNSGLSIVQPNQGTINITFKDGLDGDTAIARLRALVASGHFGATVGVAKAGDIASTLEIDITGSNGANIRTVTRQVEQDVRSVGSVDALTDTLAAAQSGLYVQVDPSRAARYGLTPASIITQLQALISGATVASVPLAGTSTDIFVSASAAASRNATGLEALPIQGSGSTVRLGDVATVRTSTGFSLITRHNQQLAARVTGTIVGADVGGTSARIERAINAIALPGDTQITVAGVTQRQNTAFANVLSSMLVAVVLVFLVMVLAFRTVAAPIAILFSLPVTLIGAAGGLVLGRQTLGLPALIGLLMLIGIVVTNAIVLMMRVQQYRERGAPTYEALLDAGTNRLRPILMTALATIGALLPLALGLAEGNLISQSLADTVIGGLVSSTILTLLVVPVVYSYLTPTHPGAAKVEPLPQAAGRHVPAGRWYNDAQERV